MLSSFLLIQEIHYHSRNFQEYNRLFSQILHLVHYYLSQYEDLLFYIL